MDGLEPPMLDETWNLRNANTKTYDGKFAAKHKMADMENINMDSWIENAYSDTIVPDEASPTENVIKSPNKETNGK